MHTIMLNHSLYDSNAFIKYCMPQQIERDFNTLIGFLKGINSDGIISTEEVTSIAEWIISVDHFKDKEPYVELFNIIEAALEDYHFDEEEILDIIWYCERCINSIKYYDNHTRAIQQLYGIVGGIVSDNIVNSEELDYLKNWLLENMHLEGRYPFDVLCSTINGFMIDGVVKQVEVEDLKDFCKAFSIENDLRNNNKKIVDFLEVQVFNTALGLSIPDNVFCITGASSLYRRETIVSKLEELGAKVSNTVTKKTDYLVVCDKKNKAWSYSMYERKVEAAIKLKQNGCNNLSYI